MGKAYPGRRMAKDKEIGLEGNKQDKGNEFYERALLTPRGLVEDRAFRFSAAGPPTSWKK